MEDMRNYLREPVRARVRLKIDDQWHDCLITNISSAGARLYLRMVVAPGTAVRVQVAELGEYDAVVVWCAGDETGLQFKHEPAEIASLLIALAR